MMNGMHIIAQVVGDPNSQGTIQIKDAVAVIIQPAQKPNQQPGVAMMNAFPYTQPGTALKLNKDHIMASDDINWNKTMVEQYEQFWLTLRAKASGLDLSGKMPNNLTQFPKK